VAAAQTKTVVVLETGAPVLTPWRDPVPAILEAWYPGQAGGTAPLAPPRVATAGPGPHCAHYHKKVLPELKTKYIDTGKVKLIFRE